MNKSQRLLNILMTVSSKKKFNIKDLTEEFHVSKRTILRDLQELSELGVPLYSELGINGGYHILKDHTLPAVRFTENEAIALFFIAESLKYYNQLPFESEIQAALKKFYHHLPSGIKLKIDQMRSKILFWVPNRPLKTPFLSDLLEAALHQSRISVSYESQNGVSSRDIQVIGVYTMNGFWYCPAYCYKSQDYRTFRVDRILSFAVSTETIEKLDLSNHHVTDWVFPDKAESELEQGLTLKVELNKRGVWQCKSDFWMSQGMTIHEDETGTIIKTIQASDVPCVVDTIMQWGTDAIVIEPPMIRELIIKRTKEILNLYNASL